MSSVALTISTDIWFLIGGYLDLDDLPGFFLISRSHAKVSERPEFWRLICLKHYGDWDENAFNSKSWKGVVTWIFKLRRELQADLDNAVFDPLIGDLVEEHFDQFYIRSPTRATFYCSRFVKGARSGDVSIMNIPQMPYTFKIEDKIGLYAPPENRWPHKSIEHSRVGQYIFVDMSAEQLEKCTMKTEEDYGVSLIDPRCPSQELFFKDIHGLTRFRHRCSVRGFHCLTLDKIEGRRIFIYR